MSRATFLATAELVASCNEPSRAVLRDASLDVAATTDRASSADAGSDASTDVIDVPPAMDVPMATDVTDVPRAMDVIDVPMAMDVVDVPSGADVRDVPPVFDVGASPERVGAEEPASCAGSNGLCSAWAACVATGAGLRRCVCAPGLHVQMDQRSCEGTVLVSAARGGGTTAGASLSGRVAANGRYVAFAGAAPQLSTNALASTLDAPAHAQCYLRDVVTGRTVLLSAVADGSYAAGDCRDPRPTADAQRVFMAHAAVLTPSDPPPALVENAYIVPVTTTFAAGMPQRIHLDANVPNQPSQSVGIYPSRDGTVAMVNTRSQLVAADTDSEFDTYLWREATRGVSRMSQRTNGTTVGYAACSGGNVFASAMSGSGNAAVFLSARAFVDQDNDTLSDAYAYFIDTNELLLLTTPRQVTNLEAGECRLNVNNAVGVSADARWVLFGSDSRNFDPTLVPTQPDLFLRDRARAVTDVGGLTRLHLDPRTRETPVISDDGRYAVTGSSRRLELGSPGPLDVIEHLYRLEFGATLSATLVDRVDAAPSDAGAPVNFSPTRSADGQAVAFTTTQALVAGDTNGVADVYVRVYR